MWTKNSFPCFLLSLCLSTKASQEDLQINCSLVVECDEIECMSEKPFCTHKFESSFFTTHHKAFLEEAFYFGSHFEMVAFLQQGHLLLPVAPFEIDRSETASKKGVNIRKGPMIGKCDRRSHNAFFRRPLLSLPNLLPTRPPLSLFFKVRFWEERERNLIFLI